MTRNWSLRTWSPLDIVVGPCAWSLRMLTDSAQRQFVRAHPSLVVVEPEDDLPLLRAAGPHVNDLPLLLAVHEPPFARRLPELIEQRLAALSRTRVDVLLVWIEDEVSSLKGGRILQTLLSARQRGAARHVGLGHADVRAGEWMAANTPVRVLMFPCDLLHQAAAEGLLAAARDHGLACLARVSQHDPRTPTLALAHGEQTLPLLRVPPPEAFGTGTSE